MKDKLTANGNEENGKYKEQNHCLNIDDAVKIKLKAEGNRHHGGLFYDLDDVPPWSVMVIYTLQQLMASLGGPIGCCYIIANSVVCGDTDKQELITKLLSTSLFTAGICTLLQAMVTLRMPVIQNSSFAYIPVIVALTQSPKWKCSMTDPDVGNYTLSDSASFLNTSATDGDPVWLLKIRVLSGGVVCAGLFQMFLGMTGIVGLLSNYIGPLSIAPTLILLSMDLGVAFLPMAGGQWGICILVLGFLMFFGIILRRILLPLPMWHNGRFHLERLPLFQLFPHFLSVAITWTLCYILTVSDVFPSDPTEPSHRARTDTKLQALAHGKWFYVPYPGQFGAPIFSIGALCGMIAAAISSTVESIGDYIATAHSCQLAKPPKSVLNRGIGAEGFAGVLAGVLGTCHSTTTYSSIIGFVSVTKVASRIIWAITGIVLIVLGVVSKLSCFLAMLPDPILAGLSFFGMASILAVGIRSLNALGKDSVRNELIIGLSILLGWLLPTWAKQNLSSILTGIPELDQIISVFLFTPMFMGGILGFTLDNILPGTLKERGMAIIVDEMDDEDEPHLLHLAQRSRLAYRVPFLEPLLRRFKWTRYIPFLPSYDRP